MIQLGLAAAVVAAAALVGCSNGDDDDHVVPPADAGGTTTTTTTIMPEGDAGLSDGEIYGIVQAGNDLEASLSQLGIEQGNAAVESLSIEIFSAQSVINERLIDFCELQDLQPIDSPTSTSISAMLATDEAQLTSLTGADFDTAFLGVMVSQFQSTLTMLDTVLVPETANPNMQVVVIETRNLVATHLAQLQALQVDAGPTP